jgi:hypothetical protein
MTFSRIALVAVAAVAMAPGVGPAFAADDAARIKQCVADNQGEGQTAAVVDAYCACMSKKMSASDAVGHHLGEFAFQRAKGLLRGSGCEEHQIERAACRAPAALAGAPIP